MALNLAERKCDCGCGQFFKPKRAGQRFINSKHRARYHQKHVKCPHCCRYVDEPVTFPVSTVEGCFQCAFNKSVASKRGKILPDRSGRCIRPGGFCGLEMKQAC
jgi:hypothetical protein